MPLSKSVSGAVLLLTCDDYSAEGWIWYKSGTPDANPLNNTDRIEGAASQGIWTEAGAVTCFLQKQSIFVENGWKISCYHKRAVEYAGAIVSRIEISGGYVVIGPFPVEAEDWTYRRGTIPITGTVAITHYVENTSCQGTDSIDLLCVSKTTILTISGLIQGQKVELYRTADNVKIGEQTCAAGEDHVHFDIDAEKYPEYCYVKVYAANGTTLVDTTGNYYVCGGDTWLWTPPYGTLSIETSAFIIMRQAASGTPKTASITATLLTGAGEPAVGKTITFTTSRGAVSPSSDTTDSNGKAHTSLTSTTHGVAVVKAVWAGDDDVAAAVAWMPLHVFYEAEEGDASKKFQFFIEGIEYEYSSGSYTLAVETSPQEFQVEIPEWLSTISRRGLVGIYRLGVKEFFGVLTKRDRTVSESPRVLLSGVDNKKLLESRDVVLKEFLNASLTSIVEDLIDSYPCGLTVGYVGDYPETITHTFADETLVSVMSRLYGITGWPYRATTDNEFEMKASFGASKPDIEFEEGKSLLVHSYSEDDSQVSNYIRVIGSGSLTSVGLDETSIADLGILEEPVFQKSIVNQSTLDLAAQAEIARKAGALVRVAAAVIDKYDAGSWTVDDWVTLTSESLELSGTYRIVKLTRDMTDPYTAEIECVNKSSVELADIVERLTRQIKDLNVA